MKAHNNSQINDHEARIVRLEVTIENINATLIRLETNIDSNFKSLNDRLWTNFFWMLGGFIGLLSLLAHSFGWV